MTAASSTLMNLLHKKIAFSTAVRVSTNPTAWIRLRPSIASVDAAFWEINSRRTLRWALHTLTQAAPISMSTIGGTTICIWYLSRPTMAISTALILGAHASLMAPKLGIGKEFINLLTISCPINRITQWLRQIYIKLQVLVAWGKTPCVSRTCP